MSDEIVLAAADAAWPEVFRAARTELLELFDPEPLRIEHVGSTAVPFLPAKPIVDIIVLVADMGPVLPLLPRLQALGYDYRPDVSGPERLFLRRFGSNGIRTHHLHIHTDAEDVERHVLFRDCLRADAKLRQGYLALKQELAERYRTDRQAYSQGKDAFVDAAITSVGGPARRPFWNA